MPTPPYGLETDPNVRADTAESIRIKAAQFRRSQLLPAHPNNGDEARFPNGTGSYTKGLDHDNLGVVKPGSYGSYITAVTSGLPKDFENIVTSANIPFVNPQSGLAFDLQGADAHSLAMPPAYPVDSVDRAAEALELYWMALCRDIPFIQYGLEPMTQAAMAELSAANKLVFAARQVASPGQTVQYIFPNDGKGNVTPQTLFRGNTPGEDCGPYVSQFFLLPAPFGALALQKDADGNTVQQYNVYKPGIDYMTDVKSWLAVQNGVSPLSPVPPNQQFGPNQMLGARYLYSGRCGAAFVHVDELYQAYFMAALNLLDALKFVSYDPNNPYKKPKSKEAGFGTFGNPHVVTLVAEVATRALKAQWYQKWFVHRALRPEEYGGLVHFQKMGLRNDYTLPDLIINSQAVQLTFENNGTYLLPMAFPEGSPQHPSYGSGHATVAGACATIVKAFFSPKMPIWQPVIPSADGLSTPPYLGEDAGTLNINTEANKIAGNVGMFRNHAGVHWRSDHEQSLKLGEKIAFSILEDQIWTYNEIFDGWDFEDFDGNAVLISTKGNTVPNGIAVPPAP